MTLLSMTNRSLILGLVLSAGLAAGCDKASDDQNKINAAEAEASQKIAEATREADQKISAAHASFLKLREDYRHTTTQNLAALDRDVDGLASKAQQASGQARADLDARLTRIHAGRDAFARDYQSLDSAAGAAWDDTRVRLDKEWQDLKALVDKG
jgi:hypothetical protein